MSDSFDYHHRPLSKSADPTPEILIRLVRTGTGDEPLPEVAGEPIFDLKGPTDEEELKAHDEAVAERRALEDDQI